MSGHFSVVEAQYIPSLQQTYPSSGQQPPGQVGPEHLESMMSLALVSSLAIFDALWEEMNMIFVFSKSLK